MDENLNLLIIDDEEEFLKVIEKRLILRGFSIRTATSCGAALAALAAELPHVVILDVMLPDKNGIDCLKEIKKSWPELAVILLTGHASLRTGMQGMKFGASDYCLKPIELGELVEKIRIAHAEMKALESGKLRHRDS
jgi:two-component system, OmpR family, response regulator